MNLKRFFVGLLLALILFVAWLSWDYYVRIYKPNVNLAQSSKEFYLRTGWDIDKVAEELYTQKILVNKQSFLWVANQKNYAANIHPGHYIILDGMNNNRLVNLLRSGEQDPVRVVIQSLRSKKELAKNVGNYIEAEEESILKRLNDPNYCGRYGFNTTTIFTLFLPNTYEFYWNTSADEFFERMALEYKRFWNEERMSKANKLGMTQSQVVTLASIVQAEQGAHPDERPTVAGLYLNRLKKNMPLQSDPTLVFARGDFSVQRVTNDFKEIDSPYNTYKRKGLPPGPILLPEVSSIEAVLNADINGYIYMCAKEDFSGYHNFSTSYNEHIINARKYQQALNQRGIYR